MLLWINERDSMKGLIIINGRVVNDMLSNYICYGADDIMIILY